MLQQAGGTLAGYLPRQQREPETRPTRPPVRTRAGSAAASASQVEQLLARLEEVEAEAAEQRVAEEDLKAVNVALMARLAEFQAANEDNVRQAEGELLRMHDALQKQQRALAAAEQQLAEEKQRAARAAAGSSRHAERAEQTSELLAKMMSQRERDVLGGDLAGRALKRKYLLLLRRRAAARVALRRTWEGRTRGERLLSTRRRLLALHCRAFLPRPSARAHRAR